MRVRVRVWPARQVVLICEEASSSYGEWGGKAAWQPSLSQMSIPEVCSPPMLVLAGGQLLTSGTESPGDRHSISAGPGV